MKFRITCPNSGCGKSAGISDEYFGKSVRCRGCGTSVLVGGSSTTHADGTPLGYTIEETGAADTQAREGTEEPPFQSSPVPQAHRLTDRAMLGRFVIRETLGSGAFGTVYRAYDPQLDREVALKVPHAAVLESPKRVERFLREARAAAQLRHPYLVPLYESGTFDGQPYMASAYITGSNLEAHIENERSDQRTAADLVRKLAEGLAYAHAQGIVHRDVKPANVLVDPTGNPLLADFGLAARADEGSRVTSDGAIMGTPAYMAPEQAAGQQGEVRPAADQYSLGTVLYELLTGRVPFEGPPAVVIHNQIHGIPERPRQLNPQIPRDLETICLKAMAKEPGDRYPDCQALADDLRRWLEGEPITARRLGLIERGARWVRREPILAMLLGLFLASLAAIGILLTIRNTELVDRLQIVEREREEIREQAQSAEDATTEARNERDDERLNVAFARSGTDDAGAAKILAEIPEDRRGNDWGLAAMKARRAPDFGRVLNHPAGNLGGMVWLTFPGRDGRLLGLSTNNIVTAWNAWTGAATTLGVAPDEGMPPPPPTDPNPLAIPGVQRQLSGNGQRLVEVVTQGGDKVPAGQEKPLSIRITVSTVASGQLVRTWELPGFWPVFVVNAEGTQLALAYATAAGQPHQFGVWNIDSGERMAALDQQLAPLPLRGVVLAFAPDGKTVAATTARTTGEIRAWNVPGGEEAFAITDAGLVSKLAFSPDGQRLAAVGGAELKREETELLARDACVMKTVERAVPRTEWETVTEKVRKTIDGCQVEYDLPKQVPVTKMTTFTATVCEPNFIMQSGPWLTPTLSTSVTQRAVSKFVKQFVPVTETRKLNLTGTKTVNGKSEPCTCQETITVTVYKEVQKQVVETVSVQEYARPGENLLRIWDRADGKQSFRVEELADITATAWRGDGERIAASTTGKSLRADLCSTDPLSCPDPNSTLVKLWHSRTARLIHVLDREGQSRVSCLAWSPDGVHLAVGFRDNTQVVCWSSASRELIATSYEHDGPVYDLTFSQDGQHLASFGKCSNRVRLWDGATGNLLRQIGPTDAFSQFASTNYLITDQPRTSQLFVPSFGSRSPRLWNRETGTPVEIPQFFHFAATETPEGARVLGRPWSTVEKKGPQPCEIRDPATNAVIATLAGSEALTNQFALLPSGHYSLWLGPENDGKQPPGQIGPPRLRVWDNKTGQLAFEQNDVSTVALAPKADQLLIKMDRPGPRLLLLDARQGRELLSMPLEAVDQNQNLDLTLLDDGSIIVKGRGQVRLFDPKGTQKLRQNCATDIVAISNDGQRLAILDGSINFPANINRMVPIEELTMRDAKVILFEIPSGTKLREFPMSARYVAELTFSPDGQQLACAGHTGMKLTEGVIDIFTVAKGERIASFRGHTNTVKKVVYRPDGRVLASGGSDGTVRLWHVPASDAPRLPDDPPWPVEPAFSPAGFVPPAGMPGPPVPVPAPLPPKPAKV